ncbi:unnamed protein product [Parnassius apollo]|uniref:(apollo) hypothetical protein n=1 Tax=Parnassius apollo TaxID=110799 RepID=A0A8S3W5H2_PARAO|nr:unnamed protein product [Parnassius apollo]
MSSQSIIIYVVLSLNSFNLKADILNVEHRLKELSTSTNSESNLEFLYPKECFEILESFSYSASNLTMCSIVNARPVRLCEKCIDKYLDFRNKYEELHKTSINGTTCSSVLISHDRLEVVLQYHNGIIEIWNKGNCNSCFDWNGNVPTLSNDTKHFNTLFNETMKCLINNFDPQNNATVCEKCMQYYLELDTFYSSLSTDAIGLDSICMDVVDSMNSTRSIWSKTLNCCKLRISPEVVFLCSAGLISFLPLIFYLSVRYCGPIRDLPKVLRESRFKQTILRSVNSRED